MIIQSETKLSISFMIGVKKCIFEFLHQSTITNTKTENIIFLPRIFKHQNRNGPK